MEDRIFNIMKKQTKLIILLIWMIASLLWSICSDSLLGGYNDRGYWLTNILFPIITTLPGYVLIYLSILFSENGKRKESITCAFIYAILSSSFRGWVFIDYLQGVSTGKYASVPSQYTNFILWFIGLIVFVVYIFRAYKYKGYAYCIIAGILLIISTIVDLILFGAYSDSVLGFKIGSILTEAWTVIRYWPCNSEKLSRQKRDASGYSYLDEYKKTNRQ